MISRRLVVALLLAFVSLTFGPSALADHAAPPVVTLIAPSSGTTVKLTSLAQDAPTFSWRVDYPTPPGRSQPGTPEDAACALVVRCGADDVARVRQ